jgi:glycosyltransferase involved in cell wall biosynthesis
VTEIGVIVAAYRRPGPLAMCLDGIRSQTHPAAEVVVVVDDTDHASARLVAERAADWPELRSVRPHDHGTVVAYNCGLAAAQSQLVAFVDDDAVPEPDWLARIIRTFERDERIAAVGGRDVVVENGGVLQRRGRLRPAIWPVPVGRIQWFGRMIANHHVGEGKPRDVDVLKGVNMSFRRTLVIAHGFDGRVRGRGAQVHLELSACLPLRGQGLRIVYDPAIVVLHYPAPREAGDARTDIGTDAIANAAHNETLAILEYFGPMQRAVFAAWGLLIGTTPAPGLAVLARDISVGRPAAWRRFAAAQRGRAAAWHTHIRSPRVTRIAVIRPPADGRFGIRQEVRS